MPRYASISSPRARRHWLPATLLACVLGTFMLSSPAGADDKQPFYDKYIPKEVKGMMKLASDIAGVYTGAAQALGIVKSVGTLLGIFGGDEFNLEAFLSEQFREINAKLDNLTLLVAEGSTLNTRQHLAKLHAQALSASQSARQWAIARNAPMPLETAQTILQASGEAVNTFDSDAFFERLYNPPETDGDPTFTGGVRTNAEWKQVIAVPSGTNGKMFEWRLGLPVYMHAIAMRLNVLATVEPEHIRKGTWKADLLKWRSRLLAIRDKMATNVKCGRAVWAVPGAPGSYMLKHICADTATGMYATAETTGRIVTRPYTADWGAFNCACQRVGERSTTLTCTYPTGPQTCGVDPANPRAGVRCTTPMAGIDPGGCYGGGFGTPRNLNVGSSSARAIFDRNLSASPDFSDSVANGADDAMSQLRINMGMFDIQKLADQLYAMANNIKVPTFDGKLRHFSRRCADMNPFFVNSTSPDIKPEVQFATNSCATPLTGWSQWWSYNPATGEIVNFPYAWNLGERWCMDVNKASTRAGSAVITWPCHGGENQRWSYDAFNKVFRNALGKTLTAGGELATLPYGIGLTMQKDAARADQMWVAQ